MIRVPHLTQDTNGKVTTSQLDVTNESQEGSLFPARDHTASINRCTRKKNIALKQSVKNIVLEGLNWFHGEPASPLVHLWIRTIYV